MNLVIVDGKINSGIEKVTDPRRTLARFVLKTSGGDEVGVEVRGTGVEKVCDDWTPGDEVHVRGRVTGSGFVAADIIRRLKPKAKQAEQLSLGFFRPRLTAQTKLAVAS